MYTLQEALQIARYYKDKVMGKELGEKGKELKISKVEVDESVDGGYNVYCYADAIQGVVFHNRIQLVAEHLGLITPNEALKEINKNS